MHKSLSIVSTLFHGTFIGNKESDNDRQSNTLIILLDKTDKVIS